MFKIKFHAFSRFFLCQMVFKFKLSDKDFIVILFYHYQDILRYYLLSNIKSILSDYLKSVFNYDVQWHCTKESECVPPCLMFWPLSPVSTADNYFQADQKERIFVCFSSHTSTNMIRKKIEIASIQSVQG